MQIAREQDKLTAINLNRHQKQTETRFKILINSVRRVLKFCGSSCAGKRKILNFKLHKISKFKLRKISKF
ncbi:hypothetical protein [uncultured Campylobacter sp.]|uniref:hypothetical protein n=1 Tax=uncultured Campylobacter sp. TaxID=218934 RepID=UPI002627AE93|nr:hypothetical protein [uncultured Campylobacter sp.]